MDRLGRGALLLFLVVPALAACGDDDGRAASSDRLVIATSVAPITSIVASIAGDRADITGLVPEGTDSHTFEPRPSAAELLSEADVVYVNGLGLEEPIQALARASLGDGAEIVELGTRAVPEDSWIFDHSYPEADGLPNPHAWTNPLLARRYAQIVQEDLSRRDPANAGYYAASYAAFAEQIGELDLAMRAAFATIPNRQLLTYHDAYPYFARDYGFDVIGAIQVSDFEEPPPSEVAALIEQVRRERVPAIFGSEVFPSPVLEQIARETDAEYLNDLRDDDLPGRPGDPDHSWLGLMLFNFITITEALDGDASELRKVAVRDAAPDHAHYPQ